MQNFAFKRPTEYYFGKDAEAKTGEMLKKYGASKVLVHYGMGSVVKSGLLSRVEESINAAGIGYVMLGGVQPNPVDTLVYEGIDLCRKEGVDFVLAVGGGSVIDSAKAIAAGTVYDGDFWDFHGKKVEITKALPVATVLTIPAAGSEGSSGAVINKVTGDGPVQKKGSRGDAITPKFSLLNPELSYTLPPFQTACGVADIMSHIFERYFTNTPDVEISDRLCEAVLLTAIKHAPTAIAEPENYAARANIYWAGTIAHDGTCGVGREEDWASHLLEHELSALYDVAHGAGLAVIFPAWMEYVHEANLDRFVRFAENVWGIAHNGDKKATALAGIAATKDFFKSIGLPTNFAELGAKKEDIGKLVEILGMNLGTRQLGFLKKLSLDDARQIYEIAAR
ncbi:MAG: iron-containing alcohol dehydrogenase [Defluviitaleaceae bacterium]|nr:iron-containing alcohol dehydrogenase [Defluviitaleaceae bacterium]